jgi:hypothetical protein
MIHWIQFKLARIPLPFERTSIWIIPLAGISIGLVLSVTSVGKVQKVVQAIGFGSLLVLGLCFLGELRDSFFREWRSQSEVRAAFTSIQDLCRQRHVTQVASGFNLTSSLRFYKIFYNVSEPEFANFDKMPSDKVVYVLEESQFRDFIRDEGLQVAWRAGASDLVVAVRPESGKSPRAAP